MDLNDKLFQRTLVKALWDAKQLIAEELAVTKELNGYALWYVGREITEPRIVAWSQYGKNDIIAYAVKIGAMDARDLADRGIVEHKIPKLDDQALKPVPPEK